MTVVNLLDDETLSQILEYDYWLYVEEKLDPYFDWSLVGVVCRTDEYDNLVFKWEGRSRVDSYDTYYTALSVEDFEAGNFNATQFFRSGRLV